MTLFTSPLPFSISVLVVDQHLQIVKDSPTVLRVKKSIAHAAWGGKSQEAQVSLRVSRF